jgi:glycosyltransferase involved in cell wall biosynthesis
MLLLDLSHTSHSTARTGVQRVARALFAAARQRGGIVRGIVWDPYAARWRPLNAREERQVRHPAPGGPRTPRGARWTWSQRLAGRFRRLRPASPADLAELARSNPSSPPTSLLVPEIFSPAVGRALPKLLAAVPGPRVAVFHDAIALTHPELTPASTVQRFPAYLHELTTFDGIAANSEASREALVGFWRWAGVKAPPPVAAIPLGLEPPGLPVRPPEEEGRLRVLCVGTIEGRKNHLVLLEAAERLWAQGVDFELRLVGQPRPETAGAALARLAALQAAGRPLIACGPLDDDALEREWARCAFSVYPSVAEGFGLPVWESVLRARPCICQGHGALGEAARGGGCLVVDTRDSVALARAMARLLEDPMQRAQLMREAAARPARTWSDYLNDLHTWMGTLPRRT